jgi:putative flippase GtrA
LPGGKDVTWGARTAAERDLGQRLRRELRLASRFGLVGIVATGVHMLVVLLLIQTTNLFVLVANLLAFLTAFGVSFVGNYVWTFGSPGSPRTAMHRFLLVSITAFSANMCLLALLTQWAALEPATAAITAATVIPAMTYIGSRSWAFRRRRPGNSEVASAARSGAGDGP